MNGWRIKHKEAVSQWCCAVQCLWVRRTAAYMSVNSGFKTLQSKYADTTAQRGVKDDSAPGNQVAGTTYPEYSMKLIEEHNL